MKEVKPFREEAKDYAKLSAACGVCFIAGAVYVLDYIEEILAESDFNKFPLKSRQDIENVIKRLKGKKV